MERVFTYEVVTWTPTEHFRTTVFEGDRKAAHEDAKQKSFLEPRCEASVIRRTRRGGLRTEIVYREGRQVFDTMYG